MSMRVVYRCAVLVLGGVALAFASGCEAELVANEGGDATGGDGAGSASTGGAGGTGGRADAPTGAVGTCEEDAPLLPPADAVALASPGRCPTAIPTAASCALTDGSHCRFAAEVDDQAMEYACVCTVQGRTGQWFWNCAEYAAPPTWCQELTPKEGASCSGHRGESCQGCACSDTDAPTWSCTPADGAPGGEPFVPALSLQPSTPLNALTDAERATLCQWLHDLERGGLGYPDYAEYPLDPDGFATDVGCSAYYSYPNPILIPWLPSGQCQGNLSLSNCAATVAELVDCVLPAVLDEPLPFPGCGPYLAQPGCDGTVINANPHCSSLGSATADTRACDLRVQ